MFNLIISTILSASVISAVSVNYTEYKSNLSRTIHQTDAGYNHLQLQKKSDLFEVGYDNRYLVNNNPSFNQKDGININSKINLNKALYFYLPTVNTLSGASKYIQLNDSARLETQYGYKDDHTFGSKVSTNVYGSTPYITQDTTIGGDSTVGITKYQSILGSGNFHNASAKQISQYKTTGIAKFTGVLVNKGGNSNNWQDIIKTKTLNPTIKSNQLGNYQHGANPNTQIGMNVPLSYIGANSFLLSKISSTRNIYKVSIAGSNIESIIAEL